MKTNDVLEHFGILGMKWGRRKSRGAAAKTSNQKDKPDNTSEDHKRKVSLKKKRLSEMSNAELRDYTTRLQLEKQYKDLTRTEMSAGKKFVMEVLSSTAKQAATTYASKYSAKLVEELLKKAATGRG